MPITKLALTNFRSFSSAEVHFSQGINLIVGANNAGKSTILKSLGWIQSNEMRINSSDLQVGKENGELLINLSQFNQLGSTSQSSLPKAFKLIFKRSSFTLELYNKDSFTPEKTTSNLSYSSPTFFHQEPENLLYLYLSRRKVASYQETINITQASSVTGNFSNLYAKVDSISNAAKPANRQYVQACQEILGFQVTAIASNNGKKAVYLVDDLQSIPLDQMGEGVANLLGIIIDLCMANNKIFLIEEPENDIHPKALKKLLNLIADKSENNQFIITTHSNIVVKYLGAKENTKLFQVRMDFENQIPTSQVEEVENSPEARLRVLEELGYEFFDFDMWTAWLILEESSAEKIIREYLIPWFAPELIGKLRTYSARSLSQVKNKFEYFNSLFVFIHLQSIYKNLAWVIIDAGDKEKEVIDDLKTQYIRNGWEEDQFLQLDKHDFEQYYPQKFQDEVEKILKMPKKSQREHKKQLLEDVEKWIQKNPDDAKKGFEDSASEVIQVIRDISFKISQRTKKTQVY